MEEIVAGSPEFKLAQDRISDKCSSKRIFGDILTIKTIFKLKRLMQSPGEYAYFYRGTSCPQISAQPRSHPTIGVWYTNGEVEIKHIGGLLPRLWTEYKSELLQNDQKALIDIAEIIGAVYGPSGPSGYQEDCSYLSEIGIENIRSDATYLVEGKLLPKDWLSILFAPRMRHDGDTTFIEFWTALKKPPMRNSCPIAMITLILSDTGTELKRRNIQHCFEDTVIEQQEGTRAANLRLYDTAFMQLVRHKFTGNETSFPPSEERFRKHFQRHLGRNNNLTPESIRFLINNCGVTALELRDLHRRHPPVNGPAPTVVFKVEHCDYCQRCLETVLSKENGSVTELDITGIWLLNITSAVQTSLKKLTMNSNGSLEFLTSFPNLEHLTLRNHQTDKALDVLHKLTALRQLYLGTELVDPTVFSGLSALTSLDCRILPSKSKSTSDIEITSQLVQFCPNLEHLAISGKIQVSTLATLSNLVSLTLRNVEDSTALAQCTRLKSLALVSCPATLAGLHAIGQLAQLEILDFTNSPISASQWQLEPLSKLTNLKVFKANTGDASERIFDLVPLGIEQLKVNVSPTRQNFPRLTRLTNLTALELHVFNDTQDYVYETVAQLTGLHTLELAPLKNDSLGLLTGLVHLKELNVREQPAFDSNGAVHLTAFPNLERMSFYHTPISDIGLSYATRLVNLEYLSLRRTKVSAEAVEFVQNRRVYLEILHTAY